jgi:hypothetical protein
MLGGGVLSQALRKRELTVTLIHRARLSLLLGGLQRSMSSQWAELIRRTLGIDPELSTCGARMRVEESVTDAEGITAMMIKMGLSATPPPFGKKAKDPSEVDHIFAPD